MARRFVIVAVVLALLAAGAWYALQFVPASIGYAGHAQFEVVYAIVCNFGGQPPLPDVDAAAAELDYRGPDGRFRNSGLP